MMLLILIYITNAEEHPERPVPIIIQYILRLLLPDTFIATSSSPCLPVKIRHLFTTPEPLQLRTLKQMERRDGGCWCSRKDIRVVIGCRPHPPPPQA